MATHYLVSPGDTRNWSDDGVLDKLEDPPLVWREKDRDSVTNKDKRCKKQSATNTFLRQGMKETGNVASGQSEGLSSVLLQLI